MSESLNGMMTRVGNRISKTAAENVADVWQAVNRGDMSVSARVTFEGKDYALLYKYVEACAKKAGII